MPEGDVTRRRPGLPVGGMGGGVPLVGQATTDAATTGTTSVENLRTTEEWAEAAIADPTAELRATEEWIDVGLADTTPELRATEVWLDVSFERDYVYLDGTILVDDANESLD